MISVVVSKIKMYGLQIATFGSLRCSNNKGVVTRKDVAICKGLADYQSNQQV